MARIRTIKPEFWTDEKIVLLPFEARLMFIGMWNFADDDGYLLDEPERIKMQVLPGDSVDAEDLIDVLCASEIVSRIFLADGRTVLHLPHFDDHQKISHKTPTKFPVNSGKKQNIPQAARRALATKYGCKPGKECEAACYRCGTAGKIHWWSHYSGKPSAWVSFSGLEIDHLVPEFSGGETTAENLVLSCRYCNRARCAKDSFSFVLRNTGVAVPDNSGNFRPEGKGMEEDKERIPPAPQFVPVAVGSGKAGDFSVEVQEAVSDFERIAEELFARPHVTPRLTLWPEAEKWLGEGFTVETLRLAVYDGMVWFRDNGGRPPKSFDRIKSLHSIAERLRAEREKSGLLSNFAHPDAAKWPHWAESYRTTGFWSDGRGTFPGTMPADWTDYATGKTDARPDGKSGDTKTGRAA